MFCRNELDNIFVEEACRGEGIGRQLVQTFIEWSTANGATRTMVSAYFLNEKAITFYKKVGFEPLTLKLVQ